MSQTKSQLLNPLNGNINVTGVITSSSAVVGTSVTINNAGLDVTGVVTATSFVGDGSGLTGVANTDFIVGTSITMTSGTFTGNVSIAGTLTYEDVTNVDSIGIITARTGIDVLAGGINAVGVVTATSFEGSGANLTNLNIPAGFTELDAALFN